VTIDRSVVEGRVRYVYVTSNMATAAASAGTVELVDAALRPYEHADLRWLVRQHVFTVLQEFPSLSPSVDSYTGEDGASAVLLNARGHLAVSAALPPLQLTLWLPREYPYRRPLVYAFPASPAAALVPDHPFVDHRTGRVRAALPYLDEWRVPASSLAGLVRSLVAAFRMCHPLVNFDIGGAVTSRASPEEEEAVRLHKVLTDALIARLGTDTAAFRDHVHQDIQNVSLLQARLGERADAMDRAVCKLEEERMMLERAVTASLRYRSELVRWLRKTTPAAEPGTVLEPQAAGSGDAKLWLESKASELAFDDAIDVLGQALLNGALAFPEYIKRVKIIAREQFFHCYAASTSNPSSFELQR
jgi:ESCRT-I complex subunit TSG101